MAGISLTSCGGASWFLVSTAGPARGISDFDAAFGDGVFLSECHGWAVASPGLYETVDGGKNWSERSIGVRTYANAIALTSERDIWVGGAEAAPEEAVPPTRAVLVHSTDRGKTWERFPVDLGAGVVDLEFCENTAAWALDRETIALSTDQGRTWTTVLRAPGAQLVRARCAERSGLWVVDANGRVGMTRDGGKTWSFERVGSGRGLTAIDVALPRALAVGRGGTVFATNDQGKTWAHVALDQKEDLFDVRLLGRTGWIVGSGGTILRSDDGGQTWHQQRSPTTEHLLYLSFLSPDRGWAGGLHLTTLGFGRARPGC